MRACWVFVKAVREMRRDLIVVALTLTFAPAFVVLYYVVFPEVAPAYRVVVVDEDPGAPRADGSVLDAGTELPAELASARGGTDRPLLQVERAATRSAGRERLERRDCVAMLVIPDGFSRAIVAQAGSGAGDEAGDAAGDAAPATFTLVGDLTAPTYVLTATLTGASVQEYVEHATGRTGPTRFVEEPLGASATRSDFEVYVPGLIVFAVIMLVFLAAMVVAREMETGAMRRLRLTRMTAVDYLAGTSAVILIVGTLGVLLTLGTAMALGFRSQGPTWLAVLVLIVTTLSVVGIGMMVAAVSRSVVQALVIANFPLGLLMFFSGSMLPMPRVTWFSLAGHPMGPFELLAPTHAVTALSKIFTLGAGPGTVAVDVAALVVLTAAYFAGGVALLQRAQRRAG